MKYMLEEKCPEGEENIEEECIEDCSNCGWRKCIKFKTYYRKPIIEDDTENDQTARCIVKGCWNNMTLMHNNNWFTLICRMCDGTGRELEGENCYYCKGKGRIVNHRPCYRCDLHCNEILYPARRMRY